MRSFAIDEPGSSVRALFATLVMNRMDYSTFLTSTTKDELDRLDNLGGTFKVQSSKLTIDAVYNGQRLPSENWEYFKECFNLPPLLIKIIEDTKDFNIVEGGRPGFWVLSFSGHSMTSTKDLRTNRGELKQRNQTGLLGQDDDFIEDGTLVSVKKNYKMINGKMEFIQNIRDSITLDKHGNLIWNYMWSNPYKNIKITKVVSAVRLGVWGQIFDLAYLLLKYGYLLVVRGRR